MYCPETSVTANLRLVTPQKSNDHDYTKAEDWDLDIKAIWCRNPKVC
jgi:hypothetical protein